MRKLLLAGCVLLGGCSAVVERVKTAVVPDLSRTAEIADKYGKPEVKICAEFLSNVLTEEDSRTAQLDALLAEPTSGLFSATLKAALVAEWVKSLQDPAKQAAFEKAFDANCGKVVGQIFINILRDARKIGARGQ